MLQISVSTSSFHAFMSACIGSVSGYNGPVLVIARLERLTLREVEALSKQKQSSHHHLKRRDSMLRGNAVLPGSKQLFNDMF